ncbi:Gp37-like protein [Robinsoniella sp. KNHs210]
MKIYVFNKDLDTIGLIDNYQSVIWTTRFFDTGDF